MRESMVEREDGHVVAWVGNLTQEELGRYGGPSDALKLVGPKLLVGNLSEEEMERYGGPSEALEFFRRSAPKSYFQLETRSSYDSHELVYYSHPSPLPIDELVRAESNSIPSLAVEAGRRGEGWGKMQCSLMLFGHILKRDAADASLRRGTLRCLGCWRVEFPPNPWLDEMCKRKEDG